MLSLLKIKNSVSLILVSHVKQEISPARERVLGHGDKEIESPKGDGLQIKLVKQIVMDDFHFILKSHQTFKKAVSFRIVSSISAK